MMRPSQRTDAQTQRSGHTREHAGRRTMPRVMAPRLRRSRALPRVPAGFQGTRAGRSHSPRAGKLLALSVTETPALPRARGWGGDSTGTTAAGTALSFQPTSAVDLTLARRWLPCAVRPAFAGRRHAGWKEELTPFGVSPCCPVLTLLGTD